MNMLATIASELVTLVIGLVLPRMMIMYYGSACNGLVCSIAQFLGFSALFRAGIGGAVRASLYKPIAEKNYDSINEVLSATSSYMHKIGGCVGVYVIIFSLVYPFLVMDEYDWFFSFSLVVIMGVTAFADNFWGIKYKILLQADQKFYIEITSAFITNAFSGLTAIILIANGFPIHFVKIATVSVYLINPLFLSLYVKKHYVVDWNVPAKANVIKNRWNAFFQQLASIFNQNVALVLLTLLQPLKEISVYAVHYMVVMNIGKIVNSCVSGINSTYGDMIAKNESENLRKKFFFTEWMLYAVSITFFSVTSVMLPSFVAIYTHSVKDVEYVRPFFALIMVFVTMFLSIRIPYQMLVEAAGKFKETRNGAIFEVVINVISSIIFIKIFGLIGVLYGALLSGIIRTIEYAIYSVSKILKVTPIHIFKHFLVVISTFLLCIKFGSLIISADINNVFSWCLNSFVVFLMTLCIVLGASVIFFRESFFYFVNRLKKRAKK